MKEIDFLPEWYKSGRQRQISYRTQYAGIGGIFVVMIVWNCIAMHSLSKTAAKLAQVKLKSTSTRSTAEEFARIKGETASLRKKAKTIEEINSKIDVANVLAEISFLVDRNIVLSKVEFTAERFVDEQKVKPNRSSTVGVVGGNFRNKEVPPVGDVKFKVLMNGVASDARDVAALICRLEDSPYFCRVIPLLMRNKEIRTAANARGKKFQVSEFEISCNLANYLQEELYFEEEPQKRKAIGL